MVAAMNPYDAVGTARISGAVYDRVCRVSMGYQSLDDELAIVVHEAKSAGATEAVGDEDFVRRVVSVVRGTREHPDVRIGSSVRGATDMVLIADEPAGLRDPTGVEDATSLAAACLGPSGRRRSEQRSSGDARG